MWPSTGNTLERISMIAEGGMYRCIIGNALIKSGSCQCQESPLTGTCHTQLLTIPRGALLNIVECTDTSQHHALHIMLVAIIHIKLPVTCQRTIIDIIVHFLLHRHRDAMDTNFQCNRTLGSRPDVASVGSDASTRHT